MDDTDRVRATYSACPGSNGLALMRMPRVTCLLITAFLITGVTSASQDAQPPSEEVHRIPLVRLLVTPEAYDRKLVEVDGYIHLEFEDNGLYLHKDDFLYSQMKNGVWVASRPCTSVAGETTFTSGYATVRGRFLAGRHGHMGLWSGSIDEAECYRIFPARSVD